MYLPVPSAACHERERRAAAMLAFTMLPGTPQLQAPPQQAPRLRGADVATPPAGAHAVGTSTATAAVTLLGAAAVASRRRQHRLVARRAVGLQFESTASYNNQMSPRAVDLWTPSSIYGEEPEIDPRPPSKDSPAAPPVRMPMIQSGSGSIDVMSRLLQDRILILSGQVNDEMANVLIAQMLYLANKDPEKDITIYINSPGGSVSAGLAIFDSMQFVPCDVSTVCFGMAASMGAFLLGSGTKGKRKALPNARIMIHQPLGGAGGQAADIEIQAKEILFLRDLLNTYLSDFSGKPMDKVEKDCDRDYFMTPEETVEYGLIDEVVKTKSWPRLTKPPKPNM